MENIQWKIFDDLNSLDTGIYRSIGANISDSIYENIAIIFEEIDDIIPTNRINNAKYAMKSLDRFL